MGRIVGPWGNRGLVKVLPMTDFPERLPGKGEVWLQSGASEARRFTIREGRLHKGLVLLGLEGVPDMNAAEALRGCLVMVDREHLERLPERTWWRHEILGLAVRREDGTPLGRVTDIISTGAHDVWVIRGGGGETLVPAVREIVLEVDTRRGEAVVRMPSEEKG